MKDAFIDCTTLEGQRRIREYVLGWMERLDYGGKLDRSWPVEELADRIWDRVLREFSVAWDGPIVTNGPIAALIALTMVEDYFAAYPCRRASRYSVAGPLTDAEFRRCVLDFIHDLEEYEPAELSHRPESAAEVFWDSVRQAPERWGCSPERGDFVDDEERAREVVLEAIEDYFNLQWKVARRRRAEQA